MSASFYCRDCGATFYPCHCSGSSGRTYHALLTGYGVFLARVRARLAAGSALTPFQARVHVATMRFAAVVERAAKDSVSIDVVTPSVDGRTNAQRRRVEDTAQFSSAEGGAA